MTKTVAFAWAIELAGMGLWTFGYFTNGNPPFFDWPAIAPWWIADWFPNIESEIGCLVVVAGMIPIYWPSRAP